MRFRNYIFMFAVFACFLTGCGQVQKSDDDTTTLPQYEFSGHLVLAEIFTATDCEYCQLAVPELETLAAECNASTMELVVAELHCWDDPPYSTSKTIARRNDFYTTFEVYGIPFAYFDGIVKRIGYGEGNSKYGNYNSYKKAVRYRFGTQNVVTIDAQATMEASKVTVSGYVSNETSSSLSDLTVYVFVLYDYGTTKHHYVVRDIVSQEVSTLSGADKVDFLLTSEALTETTSLSAVVFVQKSNKEVLQTFLNKL